MNLYTGAVFIRFRDGSGMVNRRTFSWQPGPRDRYHMVRAGEELDAIAHHYYGSREPVNASLMWWIIADANAILDPLSMGEWVGRELLIPDYDRVRLIIGV